LASEGYFILFEQTGPYRTQGDTWCRRTQKEYIALAEQCGFALEKKILITFSAHRFFERKIAKWYIKYFSKGESFYERRMYANKSFIYRTLSSLMVNISLFPVREHDDNTFGNTLFVFRKK
jgi:hypothetical protein